MHVVVPSPSSGGSTASTPPMSFPGIAAVQIPKNGQSVHDGAVNHFYDILTPALEEAIRNRLENNKQTVNTGINVMLLWS